MESQCTQTRAWGDPTSPAHSVFRIKVVLVAMQCPSIQSTPPWRRRLISILLAAEKLPPDCGNIVLTYLAFEIWSLWRLKFSRSYRPNFWLRIWQSRHLVRFERSNDQFCLGWETGNRLTLSLRLRLELLSFQDAGSVVPSSESTSC